MTCQYQVIWKSINGGRYFMACEHNLINHFFLNINQLERVIIASSHNACWVDPFYGSHSTSALNVAFGSNLRAIISLLSFASFLDLIWFLLKNVAAEFPYQDTILWVLMALVPWADEFIVYWVIRETLYSIIGFSVLCLSFGQDIEGILLINLS